jgi:isopenicillin N synthase-like dioxygenase
VIDVPVISLDDPHAAALIDRACRDVGFFAVSDHGADDAIRQQVIALAAEFFSQPVEAKSQVAMTASGGAWRGWFPLGGELTSGVPDAKEGFYVGRHQPGVLGRAMHGPNVWPAHPPALAPAVDAWMASMEALGQRVLSLMAVGLGLDDDFFSSTLTRDPTVLFRLFRYPPNDPQAGDRWGVAEHTDYGLLTLLAHDATPGLEVRVGDQWIDAPHDPDLIICNLGDMLDRLTAGRYRSTPHRVRNHADHDRYSLPFFLDPNWNAEIQPISLDDGWVASDDATKRWDRANLADVTGTYGEWLTAKVAQVFPELATTLTGCASTTLLPPLERREVWSAKDSR